MKKNLFFFVVKHSLREWNSNSVFFQGFININPYFTFCMFNPENFIGIKIN